MRRLLVLLPFAVVLACNAIAPASDVCEEAAARFGACGASLGFLENGACAGTRKMVARCVVDHAADCDELATLTRRMDECLASYADGGDDFAPELEDLPVPPADGDGGTKPSERDAQPPVVVDAAIDAAPPTWPGLDANGTVVAAQELRFTTTPLAAGSYTFTLTGTDDADLYVRAGAAPTTSVFDCRPFLASSSESCPVTLTQPAIVHVMVRGEAASSTFVLAGRP